MKKLILLLIGLLLISALFLAARWSAAAQDELRYFPESGHSLNGEFLTYYQSIPQAESLFGLPITEPVLDYLSGKMVQYFENTSIEVDLQNPYDPPVQLADLGSFLYNPGNPVISQENRENCQSYITEHGIFSVCDAFLDFFNRHGGEALFGKPISNLESQVSGPSAGRLVQYFEKARLEWHPELPPGQRVRTGELGREYFAIHGEDPKLLSPVDYPTYTVLELKVRAFPDQAIAPLSGEQIISVIVQDQNEQPVKDARVWFMARLPSGEEISFSRDFVTDENGLARISFPYSSPRPGFVIVQINAQYNEIPGQGSASFIVWY